MVVLTAARTGDTLNPSRMSVKDYTCGSGLCVGRCKCRTAVGVGGERSPAGRLFALDARGHRKPFVLAVFVHGHPWCREAGVGKRSDRYRDELRLLF